MTEKCFIGIDVGTGSARAALVSSTGKVIKAHVKEIQTWAPLPDHYEQSSDDIWRAVCECVRKVSEGHRKDLIGGIGIDATCSLVAIDQHDQPVTVSTTGKPNQNIILWMDHRATNETDVINETQHELLKYVGGKVSLEMQCPKLLWLKRNLPTTWHSIGKFFDLPDFLTYKCTGSDARSLCSVVCKWNYDALNSSWSKDYLHRIDLLELSADDFKIIGSDIREPGSPIALGLSETAAKDLSLLPGTPVGISMIDAHAGALSLFGCTGTGITPDVTTKMALICGTSSCHMSITEAPILADGIWGPYKGALFPGVYLHEAGQSATGILLDFIVKGHPAYDSMLKNIGSKHPYDYLNELLEAMAAKEHLNNIQELTRDFHVWPDFHGNRSPLADPNLRGMLIGLSMSNDEQNLAILYLATMQALAYGTRHILEKLRKHGRARFSSLIICGGLSKNSVFVQTHAEACALPVLFPVESEMVLVGAAILGACAGQQYETLEKASRAMGGSAHVIHPRNGCIDYHDQKYKVFLKMLDDQREYKAMMKAL